MPGELAARLAAAQTADIGDGLRSITADLSACRAVTRAWRLAPEFMAVSPE
jgi:hypothetical protein